MQHTTRPADRDLANVLLESDTRDFSLVLGGPLYRLSLRTRLSDTTARFVAAKSGKYFADLLLLLLFLPGQGMLCAAVCSLFCWMWKSTSDS